MTKLCIHTCTIYSIIFCCDPEADPKQLPYGMDNDETQVIPGVYTLHVSSMLVYISIVLCVISAGMEYHDDEEDDDEVIIVEPHKSCITCSQSDMEDQYNSGKSIDASLWVWAGDLCCRTHNLKTRLELSRRSRPLGFARCLFCDSTDMCYHAFAMFKS